MHSRRGYSILLSMATSSSTHDKYKQWFMVPLNPLERLVSRSQTLSVRVWLCETIAWNRQRGAGFMHSYSIRLPRLILPSLNCSICYGHERLIIIIIIDRNSCFPQSCQQGGRQDALWVHLQHLKQSSGVLTRVFFFKSLWIHPHAQLLQK